MQEPDNLSIVFKRQGKLLDVTGRVTPDRVKLFLDCCPLKGDSPPPKKDEVLDELAQLLNDVPSDLIARDALEIIAEQVASGSEIERRRVAKGRAAEPGVDGRIFILVRKYNGNTDGRRFDNVDPSQVTVFDNIEIGKVVARYYDPTQGNPGIDVFGKAVSPKPGQKYQLHLDKTLRLEPKLAEDNFQNIISLAEGFLAEEEKKWGIKTILSLNCDVGPRTGNIDFIGGVAVNGSLMNSYRVSARGTVKIVRDVLNGSIYSSNGSITILGNVTGHSQDRVVNASSARSTQSRSSVDFRCSGDFSAHAIQGVSLDIGGNIIIEREASNCFLSTRGALQMKEAHLYNSQVFVSQGALVKRIGSRSGSPTIIHLADGVHGTAEYRELVEKISKCEGARQVLQLHLGPFVTNRRKVLRLEQPHRQKMEDLLAKLDAVEATIAELVKKKKDIEASQSAEGSLAVCVGDAYYRGSEIVVGEYKFHSESDLVGPRTIEFDRTVKEFRVSEGVKK